MSDDSDMAAALGALAGQAPDRAALTAPGRTSLSFGALVAQQRRTTAQLRELGLSRGDLVAWCNVDRAQTAAAIATMPDGCTVAPLSASITRDGLRDLMRRLQPKAMVVAAQGTSVAEAVADELGIAVLLADDGGRREAGAFDLAVRRRAPSLDRERRYPAAWALIGVTSGTTGRPKLVPHGHRQVIRTSRAAGGAMGMGPGDASGHVMPLHLSGGIRSAYLQALLVGAATHCLPVADIDALIAAIELGEVTYMSASFTMQRELLARLEERRRPLRGRLRFSRVASGALTADEMDRLERALGAPVVAGLASSETGTTAQQTLDRPRKRGSVGRVLDSELRLVDGDGCVVADGEVGEIQVRGPQLFERYVDDDALNAASFVDGWFRLGDLARLDADGDLHIVGRVKEVINRGGDKIAPLEIDDALKRLPEVLDAAAFAVPHARLGEEVVAAVVMRDGAARDAEAMLTALRASLGASRAPRRLWFVERLPRTDGGKLARVRLPEHVGFVPDRGAAQTADNDGRSPFERAMAALWRDALGVPRVDADAHFADLGGDEAIAAALVARVDAAFGVALAPHALRDEASTVAKMVRAIEERRAGRV